MTEKIPGVFNDGDQVVVLRDNGPLRKGMLCKVVKALSHGFLVERRNERYFCNSETIQHDSAAAMDADPEDEGVDNAKIENLCESIAMLFSDHQKRGGSLHPYMVAALTLAALPPGTTDAERIALAKMFRETYEIMKRKETSRA